MSRYTQLITAVDLVKPKTIIEIGTWSGRSAVTMLHRALQHRSGYAVEYVGYDLFEDATDQTDAEELNIKEHYSVAQVGGFIKQHCPAAEIHLIKGNTRQTLKTVSADLCFIDGGHSLETIRSDYERVKHSKLIIMDDYYTSDPEGLMPDIDKYGCNRLVDAMKHALVLPIADRVKTGGLTQMVMMVGEG